MPLWQLEKLLNPKCDQASHCCTWTQEGKQLHFRFFALQLPGTLFSVFQEAVDLYSNRSPRRSLWEHGDQTSQFQAALDAINCPEETSLRPHCSLPQVFVEQLCLREGSGTWLPCFSAAWSSSCLRASGKTHQPPLIKPSICRGVAHHRTTGIVKWESRWKELLTIFLDVLEFENFYLA